MDDVRIRPLTVDDVPAAREASWEALREAGSRYGWRMPALSDALRAHGEAQIRHQVATDPDGAFVADRDGEVVGVGIAVRRGPLWFLSLLTVALAAQATGVGRRLLEATQATRGDLAALCSSVDPKALRRYRRAGFALHPALDATGPLDRSLLPAVRGVREGSYDDDRDLVEAVVTACRGAGHGPDLDLWSRAGRRLLVVDGGGAGRGYVVCGEDGPVVLGATTEEAASRLLWAALAESTADEADLSWMTAEQQWALDVALDARLPLKPGGSVCRAGVGPTGQAPPWAPYLPSASLG